MPSVQLTEYSNGSPRPLMINPDHVASMRPRKTIRPIDAQQDPRGVVSYNGTIVEMAAGDQHFVKESFEEVMGLFSSSAKAPELLSNSGVPQSELPWIPDEAELKPVQEDMKRAVADDAKALAEKDLAEGTVPQDQLPKIDLTDDDQEEKFLSELAASGVPISDRLTDNVTTKDEDFVEARGSFEVPEKEENASVEKSQPAKKAPAKKTAPKKAAPSGGTAETPSSDDKTD